MPAPEAIQRFGSAIENATGSGTDKDVRRYADAALKLSGTSDLAFLLSEYREHGGTDPVGAVTRYLEARDGLRSFAPSPEALLHANVFTHAGVAWIRDRLYAVERFLEIHSRRRGEMTGTEMAASVHEQLNAVEGSLRELDERLIPKTVAGLLDSIAKGLRAKINEGELPSELAGIADRMEKLTTMRSEAKQDQPQLLERSIASLMSDAVGAHVTLQVIDELDSIMDTRKAASMLISVLGDTWANETPRGRAIVMAALEKLDRMADVVPDPEGWRQCRWYVPVPYDAETIVPQLEKRFEHLKGKLVSELASLQNEILDLRDLPIAREAFAVAKLLLRMNGRREWKYGQDAFAFLVTHVAENGSIPPLPRAAAIALMSELPLATYEYDPTLNAYRCGMLSPAYEIGKRMSDLMRRRDEHATVRYAAWSAAAQWGMLAWNGLEDYRRSIAGEKARGIPLELRDLIWHHSLDRGAFPIERPLSYAPSISLREDDAALIFGARLFAEHPEMTIGALPYLRARAAGSEASIRGLRIPRSSDDARAKLLAHVRKMESAREQRMGELVLRLAAPDLNYEQLVRTLESIGYDQARGAALPWLKAFHPGHTTLHELHQEAGMAIYRVECGLRSVGRTVHDAFDPENRWETTITDQNYRGAPAVFPNLLFGAQSALGMTALSTARLMVR
jgi:hypothetical protein